MLISYRLTGQTFGQKELFSFYHSNNIGDFSYHSDLPVERPKQRCDLHQAISLVWMELAMFLVAAVVYVAVVGLPAGRGNSVNRVCQASGYVSY